MGYPEDCKYTKDHEWIRQDGESATVGITEFAQSELGEVVFVELPEIGTEVTQGQPLCVVESTKAASDVYAPVTGVVGEINSALENDPTLLNAAPHTDGWMVKLEKIASGELAQLMDAATYEASLE